MTTIDPADGISFWHTNEYYPVTDQQFQLVHARRQIPIRGRRDSNANSNADAVCTPTSARASTTSTTWFRTAGSCRTTVSQKERRLVPRQRYRVHGRLIGAPNAYIAANFNNGAGLATISNWLLTPDHHLAEWSAADVLDADGGLRPQSSSQTGFRSA